ncbi:hypothetical protein K438DRAFT_1934489 [Mycena galopus ATCC 62051]|nr:hypothetical protein K438DRAFT_1934489 [Mycena galopus ATCC 62051]
MYRTNAYEYVRLWQTSEIRIKAQAILPQARNWRGPPGEDMPDGRDRLRRRMRSGAVGYRCVDATAGKRCWSPETPLSRPAAAVHSVAVRRRRVIRAPRACPRVLDDSREQEAQVRVMGDVPRTAEEGGRANLSVGCAGTGMSVVRVEGGIALKLRRALVLV